jgi:hypothetical protein
MDWITEHIRTVCTLSGLDEAAARRLFERRIHITIDAPLYANRTYRLAYEYAIALITRLFPASTFEHAPTSRLAILPWGTEPAPASRPTIDGRLHFGAVVPDAVIANCHDWMIYIDQAITPDPAEPWNPVLALATAAYAASRVAHVVLGDVIAGAATWRPFSILDFDNATIDFAWDDPLPIGETHLAGVGAIANGFLVALASHERAEGTLHLIDYDRFERDQVGRYTFFDVADDLKPKVLAARDRLATLTTLNVLPHEQRFQQYFDDEYRSDPTFRIERLITCPDRRDTRRQMQSKLPFELLDASTGPDQIVLHTNRFQPDRACAECIYPAIPEEHAHEAHVAAMLNVPAERLLSDTPITADDAAGIHDRYPHLAVASLVGRSFDSVFKQLCSAGELRVADQVVLAPLPFTSAVAGILLYFELVKSCRPDVFGTFRTWNYAQLHPGFPPQHLLREQRSSRPGCQCQRDHVRRLFRRIWHDKLREEQ